MDFKDFTAGIDDDGRRLDRVLRILLNDTGLSEIYKLLRKGLIKVNQKKAKPDSHINKGDIISIAAFLLNENDDSNTKVQQDKHAAPSSLNIIFENEYILIIDKPYGRSVHGGKGNDALNEEVLAYYQKKNPAGSSISFRPGPLHRLDRNTSGLLVFSMSLEGAKWFSEGIKNHTIQKKYYGLAEGKLLNTETWEDRLSDSDETVNGFYTVSQSNHGDLAQTTATPLAYGKLGQFPVTLVEFAIKTGRKHQIRAQSKIHHHPLVGDKAYGGAPVKCDIKVREYYLQAYSLSFPKNNPLGLPEEIKMPLAEDFSNLLQYCEIKNPGL